MTTLKNTLLILMVSSCAIQHIKAQDIGSQNRATIQKAENVPATMSPAAKKMLMQGAFVGTISTLLAASLQDQCAVMQANSYPLISKVFTLGMGSAYLSGMLYGLKSPQFFNSDLTRTYLIGLFTPALLGISVQSLRC